MLFYGFIKPEDGWNLIRCPISFWLRFMIIRPILIFPAISAPGAMSDSAETSSNVKVKISIELSSVDDIKTIEAMLPRINDTLLAHIVELTPDEISGSDGLYNLKEELLYRINLLTAPVKVSNLNFKTFDIQKNN